MTSSSGVGERILFEGDASVEGIWSSANGATTELSEVADIGVGKPPGEGPTTASERGGGVLTEDSESLPLSA
jgi:hypothetical protein